MLFSDFLLFHHETMNLLLLQIKLTSAEMHFLSFLKELFILTAYSMNMEHHKKRDGCVHLTYTFT